MHISALRAYILIILAFRNRCRAQLPATIRSIDMTANTQPNTPGQRIAQYILITVLLALGAWMLRRFIPALAWAVILAVATWPLYERWARRLNRDTGRLLPAFTFTALVSLALVVPLTWGAIAAARQAFILLHEYAESADRSLTLPAWLEQLPLLGDWLKEIWKEYVSQPDTAVVGAQAHAPIIEWTRTLGLQFVRRLAIFGFTVLSLFFVYLHGLYLAASIRHVFRRLFGDNVLPLLDHAVTAIRATVDGVVLVAVAEGAIMCAVYALAGVSHPILGGAITGVLAMVPFAAPLAFVAIAAAVALHGSVAAAIAVVFAGAILLFVVDHFVRPSIIGDATRLPFLWVLLGILGGVESFGLIGLFIGPTLMAAICSLWRDWTKIPTLSNNA